MDPLAIGPLHVWPPVVLAPMAGVTNVAFRRLCRRFGGGLFTSEMVGARGLVEGSERSALKAAFGTEEPIKSIQLYGVRADDVADATAMLVEQGEVEHLDLNFGCPAPKVTRHGGGAALPWRLGLFADIVRAAVSAAGPVPVTVKLRVGLDGDHVTFIEAAQTAQRVGAAGVQLHARTAEQRYGGQADWSRIAELVQAVDIPVIGNGDIWEAADALRMLEQTGCAAVGIGRGCLGRPWLFRDLEAAFAAEPVPPGPTLGDVGEVLVDHARLLVDHLGPRRGMLQFRKHPGWYLLGYPVGREARRALNQVSRVDQLESIVAEFDADTPFDESMRRQPRGHTTPARPMTLPEGWLDHRGNALVVDAGAMVVSGG